MWLHVAVLPPSIISGFPIGCGRTRLNVPMDDHASLRRTCEKELTAINRKLANPATRRKAEFLSTQRTQVGAAYPCMVLFVHVCARARM